MHYYVVDLHIFVCHALDLNVTIVMLAKFSMVWMCVHIFALFIMDVVGINYLHPNKDYNQIISKCTNIYGSALHQDQPSFNIKPKGIVGDL